MGYLDKFFLDGDICVITGGAGLLGRKHAEAVLEGKGIPVLLDVSASALTVAKETILQKYPQSEIEIRPNRYNRSNGTEKNQRGTVGEVWAY